MTPAETADRNLLYGIVAMQIGFVTRDALIKGIQAWVREKDKSLREILVSQGSLKPESAALLDPLVRKHLEEHDNNAEKSLAALSSVGPLKDALKDLVDPDVQASLDRVAVNDKEEDSLRTRSYSAGMSTSAGLRFRILRPHAKGGLGEVFVARDDELNREVALKEIKTERADDAGSRARFVLEAEITGALEHPGIVPVYGLGHYADGRPFYAMRFIRGDSLRDAIRRFHNEYAGREAFTSVAFRQLLGRFIDVCEAVAYAHSRGVLHRDLKPGNIMLGKYGETLVVDWGLAKAGFDGPGSTAQESIGESALTPAAASGSVATMAGVALGTPGYMSPEQAAGRLDLIGPASDVYSLGATLYSLLTNTRPFGRPERDGEPPPKEDTAEILRRVRGGEFSRPRELKPAIPRALEAVCLKAMALKPEDRYVSPQALTDDIEHWLADEPVAAYREPVRDLAWRWCRKHMTLVTVAASLLITVAAALAVGLVLLGEKQAEVLTERNTAQKARNQAEAINRFLNDELLAAARPEELGKDVRMREVLDKAAKRVETLADQPEVEAAVRLTIGESYEKLSLHEQSEPHLRRAVELRREVLGPEHPDTLKAIDSLAMLLQYAGKHAEAGPLFKENLEARRRVLGPEHRDTLRSLHNWAWWLQNDDKLADAEVLYRECLEARRRGIEPEARYTLMTAHNLAQVIEKQGRWAEAERLHRENLEARSRALGAEHPHTIMSMSDVAFALEKGNKLAEAEEMYRRTVDLSNRVNGKDHRESLTTLANLALLLEKRGRPRDAEPLYRQIAETRQRVLGPEHPDTLRSRTSLGLRLHAMGQHEEAGKLLTELLDAFRRVYGPEHSETLIAMHNVAFSLSERGKLAEAEEEYRRVIEIKRRVVGAEAAGTLGSMDSLASVLSDRGKLAEAETLHRQTLEIRRRVLGPEHNDTLRSMNNLGVHLWGQEKLDEAEPLYRQVYEIWRRILGPEHPNTLTSTSNLAELLKNRGKLADAETLDRQVVEGRRRVLGVEHPVTLASMDALGLLLSDRGKLDEAESLLREVLKSRKRTLGGGGSRYAELPLAGKVLEVPGNALSSSHKDLAYTLILLGSVLTAKGQAKEAEPLLREALEIRRKVLPKDDWRTAVTESVLGDCLTAQGRYDEAERSLLAGHESLKAAKGAPPFRVRQSLDRIVKLYEAWGKPEKAAEWRAKQKA